MEEEKEANKNGREITPSNIYVDDNDDDDNNNREVRNIATN
jgi:hypothetical protein